MARIAIAGLQHETNTFSPLATELENFLEPDAWPRLVTGEALHSAVAGMNLPVAGCLAAIDEMHDPVPLQWCAAGPGGIVTDRAFEWICDRLLERLAEAGPIDALYLDLHGAMVTESQEDAEGELLARLRAVLGPDRPIIATLDFHANLTARMFELTDALVGYRTYPHIDMAATGARAARLLHRRLLGEEWRGSFRDGLPMRPLVWQCTAIEPMRSAVSRAEEAEDATVISASALAGFPLADIASAGAAAVAYGSNIHDTEAVVDVLSEALSADPPVPTPVYSPANAVRVAKARSDSVHGPVVLADVQDNPGAGGAANTTFLLRAMLEANLENAAFGILCDPSAAARAHRAGTGSRIRTRLGSLHSVCGNAPVEVAFDVVGLGDGKLTGTGPFYRGCRMDLGPMACIRHGGVDVVISSRPQQAADRAMFRHVGLEPDECAIIALKSAVHFRADFEPIAGEIIIVAAPGLSPIDLRELPYRSYRGRHS